MQRGTAARRPACLRVLVVDPSYSLYDVREIIGDHVAVEAASAPWAGDHVAGLLTGPDFLSVAPSSSGFPL
jgi:hypothetical protein